VVRLAFRVILDFQAPLVATVYLEKPHLL